MEPLGSVGNAVVVSVDSIEYSNRLSRPTSVICQSVKQAELLWKSRRPAVGHRNSEQTQLDGLVESSRLRAV